MAEGRSVRGPTWAPKGPESHSLIWLVSFQSFGLLSRSWRPQRGFRLWTWSFLCALSLLPSYVPASSYGEMPKYLVRNINNWLNASGLIPVRSNAFFLSPPMASDFWALWTCITVSPIPLFIEPAESSVTRRLSKNKQHQMLSPSIPGHAVNTVGFNHCHFKKENLHTCLSFIFCSCSMDVVVYVKGACTMWPERRWGK